MFEVFWALIAVVVLMVLYVVYGMVTSKTNPERAAAFYKASVRLEEAAMLLEYRPWIREHFTEGLDYTADSAQVVKTVRLPVALSAEGAMLYVTKGEGPSQEVRAAFYAVSGRSSLRHYNDKRATRKRDVIKMLMKAAEFARQAGLMYQCPVDQ